MALGPILALDVGTRTIGLACTDVSVRFVLPDRVLSRVGTKKDAAVVAQICKEKRIATVIVGLPLGLNDEETRSTRLARQVGEAVALATGLPLYWQDERYSTLEAEERMRAAGADAATRRARIDAHAAVVILEDWLRARTLAG